MTDILYMIFAELASLAYATLVFKICEKRERPELFPKVILTTIIIMAIIIATLVTMYITSKNP